MYFKQIDMVGFKSFADRTSIRLEPGVTAVVGPNGCGKSNILDALRWALGEQRPKELRGAHMQDVIFNGSENRQATGMAEVNLLFDNSDSRLPVDFGEVQITRRLYRSGESEYLINRAPCRLRDVQELFMDTGIGTNAYSLISQGKISLVLSSRPEDRRFLFEEAAGIIKYKSRKRVAMRKLEIAEQNLVRLNDIIAEVQRHMRSLKRQVNAAIRYREYSESLRELEIRSVWLKYKTLSDQVAGLRKRFAESQDAYEKVMADISRLEARNEELGLSRIEADRVLAARRDGVHQIDAEMEKTERQIALLRQQIDFSKEQEEQALREHGELGQRASAIESQIAQTEQAAVALEAEIEDANAAIQAKQDEYDQASQRVAEAEKHLEAVRARAVETMNSRAKTQTELETLAVNIQNVEAQFEAVYQRQEAHNERNEEITAQLEESRRLESERRAALEEIAAERSKTAGQHDANSQELRAINEEWQGLRERRSSLEARLRSLRELRDSYEGFAAGVRAVMAAKRKNAPEAKGVIGPVGDLLSTEKKYERAVEAALGGNINNVVVEEADAAKAAIGFLKKHKAGRVTFLPLDTIRAGQNDDMAGVKGMPGVVGPAVDHVQYDEGIAKAVQYLFYNTIIVETIDDAIRIARSERRFPRLVSLDGEVVSSSGAVTGGRTKHESRGLLGRSAEISELETQVEEADAQIGQHSERAEALAAKIDELGLRLQELGQREEGLELELNEIGVAIARLSTELDNLTQSANQLRTQSEQLEEARRQLEGRRTEALGRADAMENNNAAVQRELAEAQDETSRVRQDLSAQGAELSDLRVASAGLSQRLEETQRNKSREQQEREEVLKDAQRRFDQAAALKENQQALEEEIALNIERSKALSESREEAHKKVLEAQNQQQQLLDETDTLARTIRELHEKSRAAQSEVHQLEIELRHDEDQIAFFEERILSEYHAALSSLDAEAIGSDEYDDETREAMVADLRRKIERMGEVNLVAIEEYEALEKRNQFLVSQEEDLRKACDTLMGIVGRIDVTIREMFLETFRNVGDSFRVFFRRLFSGGQARIYLLDESDPLESGIEIEARPPGKKPQTISLLSGGEQALTAIALLFSILKAKPSPFCVLDEVDAPLDDANIGRFLELVDEFTDESQFVIITHNKQTMARAGVLYGVTMLERGVSQIVSARFDEAPEPEPATK